MKKCKNINNMKLVFIKKLKINHGDFTLIWFEIKRNDTQAITDLCLFGLLKYLKASSYRVQAALRQTDVHLV